MIDRARGGGAAASPGKGSVTIAHPQIRTSEAVFAALLSAVLMGGLYALTGDIDLDLGDEGYLWYGVQQTAAGSVPIRDFQVKRDASIRSPVAERWVMLPLVRALIQECVKNDSPDEYASYRERASRAGTAM